LFNSVLKLTGKIKPRPKLEDAWVRSSNDFADVKITQSTVGGNFHAMNTTQTRVSGRFSVEVGVEK